MLYNNGRGHWPEPAALFCVGVGIFSWLYLRSSSQVLPAIVQYSTLHCIVPVSVSVRAPGVYNTRTFTSNHGGWCCSRAQVLVPGISIVFCTPYKHRLYCTVPVQVRQLYGAQGFTFTSPPITGAGAGITYYSRVRYSVLNTACRIQTTSTPGGTTGTVLRDTVCTKNKKAGGCLPIIRTYNITKRRLTTINIPHRVQQSTVDYPPFLAKVTKGVTVLVKCKITILILTIDPNNISTVK